MIDGQDMEAYWLLLLDFADKNRVLNMKTRVIIDSFIVWSEFFLRFIYFVV
jgi:hypothetical protein